MKLGIIAGWTIEGLQQALDRGFKIVEWDYNIGNDPADLDAKKDVISAFMKANDMSVSAIGRWGPDKFDKEGNMIEAELANQKALIDLCAYFGSPVFMTGVNWTDGKNFEENCEMAISFLKILIDYGKEKGVKICCYNCHWNNFVRERRAWRYILYRLPELGIKYDVSHCINEDDGDYLADIDEFGDRIYHFHVKGTINIRGRHVDDPPAGLDMTNWPEVIGLLYAHHYEGVLSIEPHSGVWRGKLGEWGIKYTKNYIENMLFDEE